MRINHANYMGAAIKRNFPGRGGPSRSGWFTKGRGGSDASVPGLNWPVVELLCSVITIKRNCVLVSNHGFF